MSCQTITDLINQLGKSIGLIMIFVYLVLSGCASTPNSKNIRGNEVDFDKVPEHFSMRLTVKDSVITKHLLKDIYISDVIPDLYFSHKGFYAEELVLVFRSNKFHDSQWLAAVPFKYLDDNIQINGDFGIDAVRYDRGFKTIITQWVPPLATFIWNLTFENQKVIGQFISHPKREWGEFRLNSKNTISKTAKVENMNYPGCRWLGQYGELGRPGMELWNILVMGTLRLNLNCDYDRLLELVNQHKTIRQMLGHGLVDDDETYSLQTIRDNVQKFTPQVLDEINQIVVRAGQSLKKKKS